jgi:hypothetical protein
MKKDFLVYEEKRKFLERNLTLCRLSSKLLFFIDDSALDCFNPFSYQ